MKAEPKEASESLEFAAGILYAALVGGDIVNDENPRHQVFIHMLDLRGAIVSHHLATSILIEQAIRRSE